MRRPTTGRSRLAGVLATGFVAVMSAGCSDKVPRYDRTSFSSDPAPFGPLGGKLAVTNFGDDSLSFLDAASGKELWRSPVGFIPVELEGPHHVVADRAGEFLYVNLAETVAGSGSGPHGAHGTGDIPGYLLKLSTKDGSLVGFARVDKNPGDNILSADGRTAYVSHYNLVGWVQAAKGGNLRDGDAKVAVVDTVSMTVKNMIPVCPAAHGMALSADEKTLYVACAPDEIAVVDTTKPGGDVRRVLLPSAVEGGSCGACPYALAVAPDGLVWVGSLGANGGSVGRGRVDVFDPQTGAFDAMATVGVQGAALFPDFSPEGASYLAYVPEQSQGRDGVRVLRPMGRGVAPEQVALITMTPDVCTNAHAVHVAKEGRKAFVVCEGDHRGPGSIVTLDLATNTVVASTPVGVFPDDIEPIPPPTP